MHVAQVLLEECDHVCAYAVADLIPVIGRLEKAGDNKAQLYDDVGGAQGNVAITGPATELGGGLTVTGMGWGYGDFACFAPLEAPADAGGFVMGHLPVRGGRRQIPRRQGCHQKELGPARRNYKEGCLVYARDPAENAVRREQLMC